MTAPARPRAAVETVLIEIPGTLDTRLSPNRNTPPRTLKRLRGKLKAHVTQTARAWRNNEGLFGDEPIIDGPAYLDLTVRWEPGRHRWDIDNLISACKGLADGLQAANLIANDRDIRWRSVGQMADPERRGCIVVMIEGIEE